MKTLVALCAIALAGCSTITPQQGAALAEAADRYAQVTLDMTKEQLLQLLGAPQKTEENRLTWELRFGRENSESLQVRFNAQNQMIELQRQHRRFSPASAAGGPDHDLVRTIMRPAAQTGGYHVGADYDLAPQPSYDSPGSVRTWGDVVVRPGYRAQGNVDESDPIPSAYEAQRRALLANSSFRHWWMIFENACLNGDFGQLERMCDRRVLDHLPKSSLRETLGEGWRAEKMGRHTLRVIAEYRGHWAEARAQVEVTENGRTHTETFWWVLGPKGWKCQNLPFAAPSLPGEVRYPSANWVWE